jgi:hypothetical protein
MREWGKPEGSGHWLYVEATVIAVMTLIAFVNFL